MVSITNCNSPLVWDQTMLDAMRVYASHNQPIIAAPFALLLWCIDLRLRRRCRGASERRSIGRRGLYAVDPQGGAGDLRPVHGDGGHEDGCADGRTGSSADDVRDGQLARKYNLPWRTSGFHVGSNRIMRRLGDGSQCRCMLLFSAYHIWHVAAAWSGPWPAAIPSS